MAKKLFWIFSLILSLNFYSVICSARCGDGNIDPNSAERCDEGARNGLMNVSCCTATCTFQSTGTACTASGVSNGQCNSMGQCASGGSGTGIGVVTFTGVFCPSGPMQPTISQCPPTSTCTNWNTYPCSTASVPQGTCNGGTCQASSTQTCTPNASCPLTGGGTGTCNATGTSCQASSQNPICGNNSKEGSEVCDDGNSADGDCCNSTCTTAASNTTSCTINGNAGTCDGSGTCVAPQAQGQTCSNGLAEGAACPLTGGSLGTCQSGTCTAQSNTPQNPGGGQQGGTQSPGTSAGGSQSSPSDAGTFSLNSDESTGGCSLQAVSTLSYWGISLILMSLGFLFFYRAQMKRKN